MLGHISINGAELTVNVNSQERASAIKRKIARRLGNRAQFRDEEKRPMEELLEDMQHRPPDEKEEAAWRKCVISVLCQGWPRVYVTGQ